MSGKGKNKKSFKKTMWVIMIFFSILGIVFFLTTSKMFNLVKIEIVGNLKIKSEEIEKDSQLELGKNIFSQSFLLASRNISKNPRIQKVEVKRKLPNVALIKIKERRETYQVSRPEGYYFLDNQGMVLRKESVKQNLIDLKGIEGNLVVNSRIDEKNYEMLKEINKVFDMAISLNFDTVISGIDASNIKTKDIIIEMEAEDKKVHFKTGKDLRMPMLMVKEILKNEKGKKGDIFIPEDGPIYFREGK